MTTDCSKQQQVDWVDCYAAIVRDVPKLDGALCKNKSELFDDEDSAANAIALCHQCPAFAECAQWSAQLKCSEKSGVLAGEYHQWISHKSQAKLATAVASSPTTKDISRS
jgi:hypothetical protein